VYAVVLVVRQVQVLENENRARQHQAERYERESAGSGDALNVALHQGRTVFIDLESVALEGPGVQVVVRF